MSSASRTAISAKAARALSRRSPWFGSVFLKTLRDFRVAILGWGIGLGALMAIVLSAVPSLVNTPQAKQALIDTAKGFDFFWEPVAVATPGGYALWKYGALLAFPAIWGLLSGSRLLRGEEERGTMDVTLSLPRSRTRVALEKLAALGVATLLIGLLIGVFAALGGAGVNAGYSFGDALLFGLDVSLITAVFAALALFISQFTHNQGTASGFTGALFALAILLNSMRLVEPSAEGLARISPIYYFSLSKALIPSYGTNPGALLVLAGMAGVFTALALALFLPRDIGASIRLLPALGGTSSARARRLPTRDWTLRSIYARSLRVLALPTVWWSIGIGFFAVVFTVLARQTEKNIAQLLQGSNFQGLLNAFASGGDIATNAGFISIIFTFLPLVFSIYALIQASSWASDEEQGRYDLLLATPHSRRRVMLARYFAFVTSLLTITAVLLVATLVAAARASLALDYGLVVEAAVGILPIALVVASVGYLLAGWVHSGAVTGVLGALLALSFVVQLFGPLFSWPDWTQRLSLFALYGSPLIKGLEWGTMVALLAIAVVALGLGTWRFARKDVGR
ncbi:MAG TPA: ABC transporter permease subunit [Ktedonobacterales bacterium]